MVYHSARTIEFSNYLKSFLKNACTIRVLKQYIFEMEKFVGGVCS